MERMFKIIGIISLLFSIGLFVAGFFVKTNSSTNIQLTNCTGNPNGYITKISIGRSDQKQNSNYYCPNLEDGDFYTKFNICDKLSNTCNLISLNDPIGNKPYSQVCYTKSSKICDQTNIVTDIKVQNMTDLNYNTYLPEDKRCCSDDSCTYAPPLSIDLNNPQAEDVGELPINLNGCYKMGLCVEKTPFAVVQQNNKPYIVDAKFVRVDKSTPAYQACDEGWIVDNHDLYSGCENIDSKMFLCKKFSH